MENVMSQNGPDQDPWGKPGQSSGPKQSDNSSDKQNENGWGSRDNKKSGAITARY